MNTFVISGVISVIYFIARFIEMRTLDKEPKPLKVLVKDSLLVYFSAVIAFFVIDQIEPLIASAKSTPVVFTDSPDF